MASSVGPSAAVLANFLMQVEERFQELGRLVLDELHGAAPRRFRDLIPSMQLIDGEWRQGGWRYGEWHEFDWGRSLPVSYIPNAPIDMYEVDVDACFSALDRELYANDSTAPAILPDQSDFVLDFLWRFMGLREALPYMLSCSLLWDKLTHCFPFWSRIV